MRQVKGLHHARRTHHAEAMHAAQKGAHRLVGLKETAKDGAFEIEGLRPAMGAFPHGVVEVGPEAKEDVVGVTHVTVHGTGAGQHEILVGGRGVDVAAVGGVQQIHGD